MREMGRNHRITPDLERARLVAMMMELQQIGCHNINWVIPEHCGAADPAGAMDRSAEPAAAADRLQHERV
jgi:hypothetical protein